MGEMEFENSFGKIENKAKSDGTQVEMLVEKADKFSVSFQKGKPEKFDSSSSHCAGLRVIADGYEGYSYSENLSDEALLDAYKQALENAKFTSQGVDPSARVKLIANTDQVAELSDLFNRSLDEVPIEAKLERGKTLEAAALQFDERITSAPYNGYTEFQSDFQIYSSTGVRRRQRQTGVSGYSYCLAKQGDENRMAGESYFQRNAHGFHPEAVAQTAARKALAKLGASAPVTGKYPVVIENEVVCSFFGLLSDYFSAKAVDEKSSIFAHDLGKTIASSKLTIVDDPFYKDGVGTRAFDSEGAPSRQTTMVENGTLASFLTNSVYAEKMNLPHTASASRGARSQLGIGISNMLVKPGEKALEELLAVYPRVIFVTGLKGYHAGFNAGSGDFSLQAEGELWENGKRVHPLSDFVLSGNVKQLLSQIEDLSSRLYRPTGSVIAPDLLIRELSVAGKS